MNEREFDVIGAAVLSLWPSSAWPDATLAAAESMMAGLDFKHAQHAVRTLAEEGREFAPPPGVVYRLARSYQDADDLVALPLEREATPEERARGRARVAEMLRRLKPRAL